MPTALGTLYCTQADVTVYLSTTGVQERLNDSGGTGVAATAAETAYLTTQGINYATSRVNQYAKRHYDVDQLALSWLVNEWATIIAAHWLCTRRLNPAPTSVNEAYKATMEDLQKIKEGKLEIPDIGVRDPGFPEWSIMRVDPRYRVRQNRVVGPGSSAAPSSYSQRRDHGADVLSEPE